MIIGGLWHGASWNFLVWGALHGGYLAIHKLIVKKFPSLEDSQLLKSKKTKIISILTTQYFIFLAWLAFRVEDVNALPYVLYKYVIWDFATDGTIQIILHNKLPLLLIIGFFILNYISYKRDITKKLSELKIRYWVLILFGIMTLILLFYDPFPEEFIYFRFLKMNENFKIIFCIGIVFISSFFVLGLFLDVYSQGLLTSEKNIISIGGIVNQNPKQVMLDVLQNILGDIEADEVSINSLGFRGDEFTEIKPDDTYRIFLLGGSQMFGTGATSDDTTIPGYLENYLVNEDNSFTIEVINSGLKGVDSRKELLLLQNILLDFTPDLVIVYDGLNDLRAGNFSTQVLDNWNSMCELGKQNNFDVIITLQPIAGFGKKSLTHQELQYVQNGKDYENNPLVDSTNQYGLYANNLKKLRNCTTGIDLRSVFDNELDSIYIDEAHVSDKGNSIVAKSMLSHISSNMPKELVSNQFVNNKLQTTDSSMFSEFEYIVGTIFSNFEEKLILTPLSLYENDYSSKIPKYSEKIIVKTQSQYNENNKIIIIIEMSPLQNQSPKDRILKITTMDETTGSLIDNVTSLMTITKNENELCTNYFFAEDELIITILDNNDEIKISGERQYELDALIMNPDVPSCHGAPGMLKL